MSEIELIRQIEDLKKRIAILETREPVTVAAVVPASPTINYIGIENGGAKWGVKSASSNPGASAKILQTDAAGEMAIGTDLLVADVSNYALGVGTASPSTSYLIDVVGPAGNPGDTPVRFTRQSQDTTTRRGIIIVKHTTTGNMADGQGAFITFLLEDNAGVENIVGGCGCQRLGADNSGEFLLQSRNAGSVVNAVYIRPSGNVKIAGNVDRATTEGTNHLDIFDGTAPVGTLTNGISIYSASGECYIMDAAGNATLQSPHDKDGKWIFESKNTVTGKVLRVDMERMMKAINEKFGWDFIREYVEES